MRVCHFITDLNIGGAERALHALLTGGLRGAFDHHVVSLMDEGHYGSLLRAEGVSVTCLNMIPGRPTFGTILNLRRAVRIAAPDILQGWMYHGNLAASATRRLVCPGAITSWNIRQSLEGFDELKLSTRTIINLGARLSAGPSAILYNSARARAQHEARGYACARGQIITNGFDARKWAPDSDAARRLRQEVGLHADAMIIGFVGRGHSDKDIPNLLSAFRHVSMTNPTAHLVCVGLDIEERYSSYGGDSRVVYLGQRQDIERLMPGFDVLCLSSSFEGFPNVIGEAMACGVPCVTTDVGDAATVVADTGWVTPPRDSAALADALLQALAVSSEERWARGHAARARIKKHYSLESVVDQYRSLYTRLSEGN